MEDDRAAKAARAKALLNKRRANKAPVTTTPATADSPNAQPSAPPSTYTPSTSNVASPQQSTEVLPEEETRSGAATPERTGTPEPRRNSRSNGHDPYAALVAARARSPLASPPNEDSAQLQRLVQSQQQTISLLVSEKASLTTALERLEGLDERYGSVSGQLEASKRAAQTLESRSRDLEEELSRCQKVHEQLVVKERSTSESLKQRERDLELARKETLDTQHKATSLETALRDLKEQIQADDRAEKLEASLKSLQDRSNSLESQLAKTKQVLAQSKSEKDGLSSQLTELRTKEEAAMVQRDTLRAQLTELQTKFDALATEKGALQSAHDDLSGQAKKHNDALAELTRKISVEHGKSALHEKKLKSLQAELTAANRRAEEAEHAHKGLQNENVGLMASLNEMRPRIMQITEEKFDLTEKIERLEEERSDFQETIAKMESEADEARAQIERFEGEKAELQAQYEADRRAMEQSMEHAQQSIVQTEEELQLAIRSVQDLEAERGVHRQAVERYQIEMDKLDAELATLRAQFTTLQDDLAMSQNARAQDAAYLEESHGVVERANGEVEALRGELLAKEEEIERLRAEAAQTNAKRSPSHQRSSSLDKEMFESDGTFELSVARSKVRNLETTVFQEQAKAHSLRKQVNSLEEELHRLRRTSRSQQATPSFQSPSLAPAELETALDSALPPDVRHKRKISLGMLRARINSDAISSTGVNGGLGASPRPSTRHLSSTHLNTMHEDVTAESESDTQSHKPAIHPSLTSSLPLPSRRPRPQLLDDSHVFWCSCCRGDLVVL